MQDYREYFRDDEPRPAVWLRFTSITQVLIVLNVALFALVVLTAYLFLPYVLGVGRAPELTVRTLFDYVGLVPSAALGKLWAWQLVTYAFFHSVQNVLHLVFNMLVLYFFGREIETIYGRKRFLVLYFAAAAFAGLGYCAFQYSDVPLIGASGAVYAVMVVYAFHYPRQRVLFFFLVPLEIWVVVAILIGLDVTLQITGGAGSAAPIAHLAGALFGFLFFRLRGRVETYFDRLERRMERAEREHEEEIEARLDTLLEKISRDGMNSLTKKEREFLKRASRHYQNKA